MTRLIAQTDVEALIDAKLDATNKLLDGSYAKAADRRCLASNVSVLMGIRNGLPGCPEQAAFAVEKKTGDCPYGFIVTFMPEDEQTVDKMVVMDAWGSSAPDMTAAYETMRRHALEDRDGRYSKMGAGRFTVALQGDAVSSYALNRNRAATAAA